MYEVPGILHSTERREVPCVKAGLCTRTCTVRVRVRGLILGEYNIGLYLLALCDRDLGVDVQSGLETLSFPRVRLVTIA
jgi:hypothetical protein